jgi:hypothetical protein
MIVESPLDSQVHRCAKPIVTPAEALVAPTDSAQLQALIELTDAVERHRALEVGARICALEDDYVGDHPEYVLTPFTAVSPSRFSDGSFGVLYAAFDLDTAAAEAAYWLTEIYRDTVTPAGLQPRKMYLTMRATAVLPDVRRVAGSSFPKAIYDSGDYSAARSLGCRLHSEKADGVWYDSVRRKDGECVGAFVPRIISAVQLQYEVEFQWDGSRFIEFKPIKVL